MTPQEETEAAMHARLAIVGLPQLADMLEQLEAMSHLDDAHRLTRLVVIDEICARCPAAETAFQAWADSDVSYDPHRPMTAIIAAVRTAQVGQAEGN